MVRANDSLVDADGLVDDRALVVVMVVRVMRRAVNDSLGHADVLTVAWLVSSTVFTLDLVNGAEIFFRKRLVVVVRLVTVVTVGVDLNMSVRVGGASRSVGERKKQSGSAVKSHLGLMHICTRSKAKIHQGYQSARDSSVVPAPRTEVSRCLFFLLVSLLFFFLS